jgi:hypothetical protein
MKRILVLVSVLALSLVASGVLQAQDTGVQKAQESPFVGTWKLNLAKSKFAVAPAPKSETRTVAAQGNGLKFSFEGIAADGSKISWSYTSNLDGKPVPVTGSGVPYGAEMLATKRPDANANTLTTSYLKAGNEIRMSRTVVSNDGRVTTITGKGTDANGKPITTVTVWDKQ